MHTIRILSSLHLNEINWLRSYQEKKGGKGINFKLNIIMIRVKMDEN